jgi:hypothetical protein
VSIAAAAALMLVLAPGRARAQEAPAQHLGAGFSLLHDEGQWAPGPAIDYSRRFVTAGPVTVEGVGEFGMNKFLDVTATSFGGGARVVYRVSRARLFGQFLIGAEHAIGETDFATQPGFGVDVRVKHNVSVRGQLDIRTVRIEVGSFTENRYTMGVAFGF